MGSYARRMRADAAARATPFRNLDAYLCPTCGKYTVTVEAASGLVPETLGCRASYRCPGYAVSQGHPNPWPEGAPREPGWEWYMPDGKAFDRVVRAGGELAEHLRRGGLLVRKYRR